MTGNVRKTQHWGAFTKPLLSWKKNKYYIFLYVYARAWVRAYACVYVCVHERENVLVRV
jgi:hypothetical protein